MYYSLPDEALMGVLAETLDVYKTESTTLKKMYSKASTDFSKSYNKI